MVITEFRCEEVGEGDVLVRARDGGNCCFKQDHEYLVERNEEGVLFVKASCWREYEEENLVEELDLESFDLIRKNGPW